MSEEFDEEYEERRRRRNARNEEMRKRKKKQQMIRMLMRRAASHCRDYTGCGNSYYKWKKHHTRNTGISGSSKN